MLFLSLIHICPYIYIYMFVYIKITAYSSFTYSFLYIFIVYPLDSHPFLQFVPSVSVQLISWVSYCFCLQCCWRFTSLLFYVIVWLRTYTSFGSTLTIPGGVRLRVECQDTGLIATHEQERWHVTTQALQPCHIQRSRNNILPRHWQCHYNQIGFS